MEQSPQLENCDSMTRVQLHDHMVERVRQALSTEGIRAHHGGRRAGSREAANRFDLLTGDLTIAVRVAKRSSFSWRVSVNGKRYSYRYSGHRWNLHSRGSTNLRPDVWVFVAAGEALRFFVVPGRRVRGFYTLTLREPSKTWLRGYADRWETLREVVSARHQRAA